MIGGMATATLLTLFVIPALFVIWKQITLRCTNRNLSNPEMDSKTSAIAAH